MLCSCIQAQKVKFGLEQHLGLSTYTRGLLPFDLKLSSSTGLIVGMALSDRIKLRSGLYFHSTGANNKVSYGYPLYQTDVIQTVAQSCLRLPLFLNVRIGKKKRFSMEAGGYFNYFIQYKISTDSNDYPYDGGGMWVDLELDQHDFGIIIRQEIAKSLYNVGISIGLQEEIGLNPLARGTVQVGTSAFITITFYEP